MLHALLSGFAAFGSPSAILMLVLGTVSGIIIGATPGLGGIVLLSMILPFLYGMKLEDGLILMLAAEGGTYFAGSVTSILLNTPGTPESAATIFDGYEMTKQGKAARALGISACATTLGGWIGFACLMVSIPAMFPIIKLFQPSDYFALAIMAIILVGQLRAKSLSKGILSGLLGMMVSYLGYDPITGVQRFTFHLLSLYDGFNVAAVALGLFAVSEMFVLYGQKRAIGADDVAAPGGSGFFSGLPPGARVIDGVRDAFARWKDVLRSGLIGTFIGLLPGIGGTAATFISYGVAKRVSKHPERFGQGCPEGIVAPEAAVMAKEGGSLVPTVALGVPGSAGMAVVLSGLTILGVAPGPSMLTSHLSDVFTMAFAIGFASLLGSVIGLLMAPMLARALKVPPWTIVPFILALSFLGASAATDNFVQAYVVAGFGIVGLAMKHFGYSPASTIVGFVLGPIVEKNLYLMVNLQGMAAFHRPLTNLFLAVCLVLVVWPVVSARRQRRARLAKQPIPQVE